MPENDEAGRRLLEGKREAYVRQINEKATPILIEDANRAISEYMSHHHESEAHRHMIEALNASGAVINPMPGVVNQGAAIMSIDQEVRALIMHYVNQAQAKHPGEAVHMIDVGTFSGESAEAGAEAGAHVTTLDIKDWNPKSFWQESGVDRRIEHVIAPAQETMQRLIHEGRAGTFDLVCIDADKSGYAHYYELAKQLLRPGGKIIVDNALWSGRVADSENQEHYDDNTQAIDSLNRRISFDKGVQYGLLPHSDGIMIAENTPREKALRKDREI